MIKQYPTWMVYLFLLFVGILSLNACQNRVVDVSSESMTPTYPSETTQERLIIWGRETWPDGDCILWIANPNSQESTRTVMESSWCNVAILTVSGSQKLVSFSPYHPYRPDSQESSEIWIYQISEDDLLQHEQTISLEGLYLTSPPQWGQENEIFFSAIENGKEGIYRYESDTQTATLYITAVTGFATNPVISPDGRYLAYEVWENHISKDECGDLSCNSQFIHVWDVESNVDIEMASLIEPFVAGESYFSHCEPEWSQNDSLLAISVGCEFQAPGSIVIFNPNKNGAPIVINSINDKTIAKIHWVEGNRLIISGEAQIYGQDSVADGYLLYSSGTNVLEEMVGLPERNMFGYDLIYFSDWTTDAKFAVGQTQVPGDERTVNIVKAASWSTSGDEMYIPSLGEFIDDLAWSPTNRNIAYRSYDGESHNSQSRFIIIDANGSLVFDGGKVPVVFPKMQWYVRP